MCLCVIYVIVRCCILVPGIYDSDLDPDTLDCWLSFAHSSIRSVCECFTSGSNPLTDKSWKPLYHYELLRHAVKMLLCLQQIYAFYLIDCYKPGVYLFRGSHDRLFLDVKFFRLLLGNVPGVIYSIGETSLVSACRVLLLMFSIFEEKNVYHLSVCLIFGTNILNILVIGFPLRYT